MKKKREPGEKREPGVCTVGFMDDTAQYHLLRSLRDTFGEVVNTEQIQIVGHGSVTTCVTMLLDNETPHKKGTLFSLRASVNGGIIKVYVGDGIVQLQRMEWRRRQLQEAIAWIQGYVAGYQQ